jgi:DNA-binding transcriptional MerR regulator
MPIEINGQTYYRTSEVCQIAGIGKSTLLRWIRQNIVNEAENRDRKGWRLFTGDELNSIIAETSRIQRNDMPEMSKVASILR